MVMHIYSMEKVVVLFHYLNIQKHVLYVLLSRILVSIGVGTDRISSKPCL